MRQNHDQFSAGQPRAQPQGKKTGEIAEQTCNQQTKMARIGLEPRAQLCKHVREAHDPNLHRHDSQGGASRRYTSDELIHSTTKNAAKTPQINKRNRLPLSALRCHRDRLSTTILAPFLAVETVGSTPGPKVRPVLAMIAHSRTLVKGDDGPDPA